MTGLTRDEERFLARLTPARPAAFVLGGSVSHSLAYVRSLGRRGIPVVVAASQPGPRVGSRYSAIERHCEGDADLLAWLEAIGSRLPGRGVLLAPGDPETLLIARNGSLLARAFRSLVPRLDLLELLTDKRRQASYLSTLGVPIPCTRSPATGDPAGEMASSLDFPCLVKPAVSFLWHPLQRRRALGSRWAKAVLIQTADELRVALDAAHADGLEVIVQEFVPGGETRLVAFYGFFDETSAPLATFVARKLRQWPPVLGSGSYSVGCREPSVVDIAVTMLRRMRYQGMVNVEFKHDPRDGRFKLIEINCRSGNRLYLPVTSGIDLPWIAYSHLTGAPVRVGEPRDGLRWIDDTRDLAAFGHYRREQGLTPRDWARSAWTAESHAYFAADDPLPFLADLWRAGGALWKRRR